MPGRIWTRNTMRQVVGSSGVFANVVAMLTGTVMAQAITLGMAIPLARLYGPAQFGLFAIVQSVAAVGITVAALRYDLAIVLPDNEADARALQRLASRAILVTSLLLCIGLFTYNELRPAQDSMLGHWLVASGILVFLGAQIINRQYWLTRHHEFRAIARNRVLAAAATGLCQMAAAIVTRGFEGLVLGYAAGQLIALGWLMFQTRTLSNPVAREASSMSEVAKRYRKMPLINGPTALLDAVRELGINLLIANVAVAGLGQYNMASRMAGAPVGIISGSISQVFLHRMATTKPGDMTTLVSRTLLRIGLISAPLFFVLYFVAPALFATILGSAWADAGNFARALIPWLFLRTFTSPLSNVFIVTGRQEWPLLFALPYTMVPLSVLALADLPLLDTVYALGWIMAALLCVWTLFALLAARRFDRSRGAVGGS